MNWIDWVDKQNVFIKMEDGQVFSNSKILAFENPFLSLTDKYGYPAIINVSKIIKIREEG